MTDTRGNMFHKFALSRPNKRGHFKRLGFATVAPWKHFNTGKHSAVTELWSQQELTQRHDAIELGLIADGMYALASVCAER